RSVIYLFYFNNKKCNLIQLKRTDLKLNCFRIDSLHITAGFRLSTSQLCTNHVRYLIRVSTVLVERRDSIETIMLNNMIGRLYELLAEDVKSTLFDDLVNLDADCNTPALYWLAAKMKGSHLKHSVYKFDDLPRAFLNLREHSTTRNWKRLVRQISAMQVVNYSDNRDISDVLGKMWNFVADAIPECEGKQLDVLSDFLVAIFDGTRLDNLRDYALDSILMSIVSSCTCMLSSIKIKLCQYLRQNVENVGDCEGQSISALIKLFSRLLEDESPWVRQEALETFEYVGHTCSEHLVARIAKGLAKIPTISNVMQAYLSCKRLYVLEDFSNVYDYLGHVSKAAQSHREHMCYEHEESEREKKIPRLEEENSQDIAPMLMSLDKQAEKMYKGLTEALEGRANISETICRKLITVLETILNTYKK
ncbi:PREDICTED: uncharacterized protein LOC106752135, partial [Dinoponera quadriceps]|uniref:Uncharacterized protein LOC106752135 n=1 Tax=Dinoponera quadriceps TaxID=609295 RepID=A0A6P3YDB4_DINQU